MNNAEWALAVKARDGWKCVGCGHAGQERTLHAHHVVPRALGGEHALENGVTLCTRCHGKKHRGEMSGHALMKVNVDPFRRKGSGSDRMLHLVKGAMAANESVHRMAVQALENTSDNASPLLDVIDQFAQVFRENMRVWDEVERIRIASSLKVRAAKIREAKKREERKRKEKES